MRRPEQIKLDIALQLVNAYASILLMTLLSTHRFAPSATNLRLYDREPDTIAAISTTLRAFLAFGLNQTPVFIECLRGTEYDSVT